MLQVYEKSSKQTRIKEKIKHLLILENYSCYYR